MAEQTSSQGLLNTPLKLFLEMCLWEKGIRESDEEVRAGMVEDLAEDYLNFLWQAMFSRLSEEDLPEWKKMMETQPSPEAVENFLKARVKDYEKVVEDTMVEFKDIYVSA